MTNLLFFGSDYGVGLTTALTEQILELSKHPEFSLFCVSSENEMESGLHKKIQENNIKMDVIQHLDVHSDFNYLSKQVETVIKNNNITHVNVHNNWQLAIVSYIKYKKIIPEKFKIIYTIHGYRHNSLIKAIFAIGIIGLGLLLFADRVISMSSYVSKRFWFIRYKTDLVFYVMNKPEFNKSENIINSQPLKMVFPAQFREGKNQNKLIQAVKLYIDETNDKTIELHLPGEGPLLEESKNLVKLLNLNNNVFFPGKMPHEEVVNLYEKSNIALVSSNVETYGRCIAEPFALGRCVITKKTGIALDIIKNNKNGFFFSNEKELADILNFLYKNPQKIADIGQSAFDDKYIFSKKNVMDQYIQSVQKA